MKEWRGAALAIASHPDKSTLKITPTPKNIKNEGTSGDVYENTWEWDKMYSHLHVFLRETRRLGNRGQVTGGSFRLSGVESWEIGADKRKTCKMKVDPAMCMKTQVTFLPSRMMRLCL
jgi:hypothetical protein